METPQLANGTVLEKAFLRRVLGAFATGVTVVTAGGEFPHGMTANSFTSVSLDPPLILVCVGRDALMHGVLTRQSTFAVSILAADQTEVARYFADKRRPVGRTEFDTVSWSPGPHSGAPLIDGALAHLECEVAHRHEAGDHTIYVGRLLSLSRRPGDDALLFLNGQFLRTDRRADPALAGSTAPPRRPGPAGAA
ncbi:flavin reductase family protein [Phytohabitans suffuscus]|uniref:Oxidoreductase n=1 Tax=Phytohabitans suffuscus TaxID=624315 RepID=A0A6F8YUD5_9ACTN|nr:flavin reductase family protein [Phytohabitans suffuscus]BCB89689.1 oxidoreductase [Phytohabitans suffuscus]